MTLKLFEMEGEFGYICESLDDCMREYGLDEDDRDWVVEASPDKRLTISVDTTEDPIVPAGATLQPTQHEGICRVTATVAEWIEAFGCVGELWSAYT